MKSFSTINWFLIAVLVSLLVGCIAPIVSMVPEEEIDPDSSIIIQGEGCRAEQLVMSLEGQLAIDGYSVISSSKGVATLEIIDEVKSDTTIGEPGRDSGGTEVVSQGGRRLTSGVAMKLPSDYVVQFETTCGHHGRIESLYGTIYRQASGEVIGYIEHDGVIDASRLARSIVSSIPVD